MKVDKYTKKFLECIKKIIRKNLNRIWSTMNEISNEYPSLFIIQYS